MIETMTVEQAKAAGLLPTPGKGKSKWLNCRTPCSNGHIHASGVEARRCEELHLMQQASEIIYLVVQPRFVLQAKFSHHHGTERAITYTADFSYYPLVGDNRRTLAPLVVEDVKGGKATRTAVFHIKRKLLLYQHPEIDFRIVEL